MGEMKGALVALTLFLAVIMPIFLGIGIEGLNQYAFMKHTTEITEVVREEGGVTDKVRDVVDRLRGRGYTIAFSSIEGGSVNGRVDYGDTVVIDYKYKYKGLKDVEELRTQNVVTINRR